MQITKHTNLYIMYYYFIIILQICNIQITLIKLIYKLILYPGTLPIH